jgi:hypothetical protein
MRLPMMARSRVSLAPLLTTVATASLLLVGCARDTTAPNVAASRPSELRTSPFVPTAAQRALVGVSDGTYRFTVNPGQSQSLSLGASGLYLPANAICSLASSGYGASRWNDDCAPETSPVTITAIVTNAATDHPSVDFQPAMRFNPRTSVYLYLAVTNQATLDATKVMKYCNASGCTDESLMDRDLRSYVDVWNKMVFRRIKHFSGYVVAEYNDSGISSFGY